MTTEIETKQEETVPATATAGGGGDGGRPAKVTADGQEFYPPKRPKMSTPGSPLATLETIRDEGKEPWKFYEHKEIRLKGGPMDYALVSAIACDADGLLYFFRNDGSGKIEQAVYRIELEEVERTEDERRAGKIQEWNWVGTYVGRRYLLKPMVNGIRKGS